MLTLSFADQAPMQTLLRDHPARLFRLFCLQHHYGSNVDYNDDRMRDARALDNRFAHFFASAADALQGAHAPGVLDWAGRLTTPASVDQRELDHQCGLNANAQCASERCADHVFALASYDSDEIEELTERRRHFGTRWRTTSTHQPGCATPPSWRADSRACKLPG